MRPSSRPSSFQRPGRRARKRGDSGNATSNRKPSASGSAPPRKNSMRQPYKGRMWAENRPASIPPRGTQTMVAVTATVRRRAGVNSAVMVVALGKAPPIPSPATKRSSATVSASGARPMAQVAEPNRKTLATTAVRLPKRSANRPAQALPIPIPISPAATAGAKASRLIPHSWIINGMAKPMSWPSKPSSTMESAASRTTSFCMRVKGPSSSRLPISATRSPPGSTGKRRQAPRERKSCS